jgi:hypothetical protein
MKKIIILALFSVFLMGAKGCQFDLTGFTPAILFPKDGYANKYTIAQSCPIKVLPDVKEIPLNEMSGWVCIPESQFAKIRREYESECK